MKYTPPVIVTLDAFIVAWVNIDATLEGFKWSACKVYTTDYD